MPSFWSRPYRGIKDLHLLIKFAGDAAGARLPHSTYMKPGDIVWGMPASRFDTQPDIRLWFDGAEVAAYGLFEPPLHVDFDIMPGLVQYDLAGEEILKWAEHRRQSRPPGESIPKAYAMLGADTVSAIALGSDGQRIALLENRGYRRTDRFSVLYAQGLDGLIAVPPLGPGLRLRHATDDDLEERVDVHRDAWSVWGPSAATVETYGRLRAAPLYDAETRCGAGRCGRAVPELLHRMAGSRKWDRAFRAGRMPSCFYGTRVCARGDIRNVAQDAGARDAPSARQY